MTKIPYKKQNAFGFSMIELLIALMIILTLSVTAASICYYAFTVDSVSIKISDSIKQIKQATTNFYFHMKNIGGLTPNDAIPIDYLPLTLNKKDPNNKKDILLNDGYLDPSSIYQGASYSNGKSHDYTYTVKKDESPGALPVPDQFIITLTTYQSISLQQAHPSNFTLSPDGLSTYTWKFTAMLPTGAFKDVERSRRLNLINSKWQKNNGKDYKS